MEFFAILWGCCLIIYFINRIIKFIKEERFYKIINTLLKDTEKQIYLLTPNYTPEALNNTVIYFISNRFEKLLSDKAEKGLYILNLIVLNKLPSSLINITDKTNLYFKYINLGIKYKIISFLDIETILKL